ncbi:aldo/keto reductase [Streptomyces rimosus]|uniref:aldo/keto reductase n=1 Tax=Streptomyces rimosus TaxID=1927 RepID=UPI0004C60B5C|nr:aldo/keto reductase [Streptomyces rimosus]
MRTTTLGSTGPEVGVIGLGCMGMTHAYDPDGRDDTTSAEVIRQAIDLGVTLIDTADVYGPYTNEELVGRALAGGHRERVVLATKVGLETGEITPENTSGLVRNGRPEHIRRSIDASLRRLGTDHVDLYQLHRVDPDVPVEESWGALAEAVQAGKARHIGLSEPTVEEIRRAQAVHPVASVQSELSLWTRDVLDGVLPYCEEQGIAFLPFSPLGRGFLTGSITSFEELAEDDFRRRLPRFQQEALKANLDLVAKVRAIAGQYGASPAQVALAWVLAQGRFVVPIPGTKTPKYLVDNAGAADLVLPPEALAELDALPAAAGTRY